MFRRRFRFQNNPMAANQLAILGQVNQLMSEGKPAEAGQLLAGVADRLQQNNRPRLAANVYARAAHAFADGKDEQSALRYAKSALAIFTQNNMVERTPVFLNNITNKMRSYGMNGSADALQQQYGSNITAQPVNYQSASRRHPELLPTNCPNCGAMVHNDEADWVDDNTVKCEYCGALIRTKQ